MRQATVPVTAAKVNYARYDMCFATLAQCFVLLVLLAHQLQLLGFADRSKLAPHDARDIGLGNAQLPNCSLHISARHIRKM